MPAKKNYKFIFASLVAILLIFLILNLSLIFPDYFQKTEIKETQQIDYNRFLSSENGTFVSMNLVAVDSEGNGVTTPLFVEATKGTGRTLVDIENLLFWADTQHSIRIARLVAGNISIRNLNEYDLVYNIKANASLIGGPSAGASIALATIAALEGRKPREDVIITGTINHDGTIGPVQGILEKAKGAKNAGATIFIVPLLQSREIVYESSEHCEKFGGLDVCTTETKPKKVDIENETGIKVVEAGTIQDAMEYFF